MHHHRRKSGHTSGNTSMTDVRKAVTASDFSTYKKHSSRPATMTRRITPQSPSALKLGKSPRDRERELDEERWWDEEREAFPQYCMYCETQFLPSDDQSLYCSDRCRYDDELTPSRLTSRDTRPHPQQPYPLGSYSVPEPLRDIVPRASPSGHFSPPTTPATHHPSSIKSFAYRPPSPPSPVGTFHSHQWAGRSTQTSPGSSYVKTNYFPSTYDGVYYGADHYGSSTDRPLPTRRPGVYSRPKSIELVTPMLGGR
ncbi:hypothetical protein QBC35DRAFT_111454 [Podospora australis]|uniref:Life-span regulatory factor domain-containing protein n=1 Tax=Podospora australis TaxID=1536484 RepID=A0AAN7AL48_9PEZI|nr:hypothetical protein QBC35DRAFT_111454 [Podospora australis]